MTAVTIPVPPGKERNSPPKNHLWAATEAREVEGYDCPIPGGTVVVVGADVEAGAVVVEGVLVAVVVGATDVLELVVEVVVVVEESTIRAPKLRSCKTSQPDRAR